MVDCKIPDISQYEINTTVLSGNNQNKLFSFPFNFDEQNE